MVAGEASGDLLAAELVPHIRDHLTAWEGLPSPWAQPLHASLEPRFFGAGGPRSAAAGVALAFDLTAHSVVGLSDVLRRGFTFLRLFRQLFRLAIEREPDAIICVDFSGFNRRFARAVKRYVGSRQDWFHDWNPKIIQYVSPQVWASREGRAYDMAKAYDLVLSIVPFEKDWYAKKVPQLNVQFVGNPILNRYRQPAPRAPSQGSPVLLLLPGSRPAEVARHLPVMAGAFEIMSAGVPGLTACAVLPNEALAAQARALRLPPGLQLQTGRLAEALGRADVAIASTGTVTLECAYFGLPTVALYKTSWINYQIAKHLVRVQHLAMPNLLAGETLFPEFIQDAARPELIANAALDLLRNDSRRQHIKTRLAEVIGSLGTRGAAERAASAIIELLKGPALSGKAAG